MANDVREDIIDILEAVSKAQLNTLRRLRRSTTKEPPGGGVKPAKSMSQVDMAYDILRSAGRPLQISEIITLVAKRHAVRLDRESIVSALAKRIARKDRFVHTGPNTFSVLPTTEK